MTKSRIREIREASAKNSAHAAIIQECLQCIEAFQRYTRRGETPPPEPEPEVLPPAGKSKKQPGDPRVKQLILAWSEYFEKFHRTPYKVAWGKDGAAAKRLVKIATIDDLLDLAWSAWHHPDKFNCKAAVTLAGFDSRYNDIQIELKTITNGVRPQNQGPAKCQL